MFNINNDCYTCLYISFLILKSEWWQSYPDEPKFHPPTDSRVFRFPFLRRGHRGGTRKMHWWWLLLTSVTYTGLLTWHCKLTGSWVCWTGCRDTHHSTRMLPACHSSWWRRHRADGYTGRGRCHGACRWWGVACTGPSWWSSMTECGRTLAEKHIMALNESLRTVLWTCVRSNL